MVQKGAILAQQYVNDELAKSNNKDAGAGKVGITGMSKALRRITQATSKRNTHSIPMAQVRSMFQQRLQALMLQDIKAVRKLWREFAGGNNGVLSLDQFHQVINTMGLDCTRVEAQELMSKFSDRTDLIRFDEFWHGIMALPRDFFSMSFTKGGHGAKMGLNGSEAQIKPLLPESTSLADLDRKFKVEIRKRLFDVPLCLTRILRCPNSQTHFGRDHLWNMFQNLGVMLRAPEVDNLMSYFDRNDDGRIHFKELACELLGLPRPLEVSHMGYSRTKRSRLVGRSEQLVTLLRLNCERAAAPPHHILEFFKQYDKDGSGQIAYDEFKELVRDNGCQLAGGRDSAAILLKKYSASGRLSYLKFITEVLELRADALRDLTNPQRLSTPEKICAINKHVKNKLYNNPEVIKRAFRMFDVDGGGSIGLPEFERGVDTLDLPMNGKQTRQLFESFDESGDQKVDMFEFAQQALGLNESDEEDGPPLPGKRKKTRRSQRGSTATPKADILVVDSNIRVPSPQKPPKGGTLPSPPAQLSPVIVPSRRCATAQELQHSVPLLKMPQGPTTAHALFMKRAMSQQQRSPPPLAYSAPLPPACTAVPRKQRGFSPSKRPSSTIPALDEMLRSNELVPLRAKTQGDALRSKSPPPRTALRHKADARLNSSRHTFDKTM